MTIASWWDAGSRRPVRTGAGPAELFVWEAGSGPAVTLLHGYPGSSHDWAGVAPALAEGHRVIAPDLLGFGASDKPHPHPYSIREQADLVEQLWDPLGVANTALVAHDYSSSIAQELLRRGAAPVRSVVLMNGGVHPALHRPTPAQVALLGPDGDALTAFIDEGTWTEVLATTFGPLHPLTSEQGAELWAAFSRDGGTRLAGALLHYIADRAVDGDAWVEAMEATTLPLAFVWGPEDPISGAHMIAEVERRTPEVTIVRLDGVGHWPMLEDPGAVTAALLAFLRSPR